MAIIQSYVISFFSIPIGSIFQQYLYWLQSCIHYIYVTAQFFGIDIFVLYNHHYLINKLLKRENRQMLILVYI